MGKYQANKALIRGAGCRTILIVLQMYYNVECFSIGSIKKDSKIFSRQNFKRRIFFITPW